MHFILRLIAFVTLVSALHCSAAKIQLLAPATAWQRLECRIEGVPDSTNPFDPDVIAVDAFVTTPSGKEQIIPAFFYQAYTSSLVEGEERLTSMGAPEWRLRYIPTEPGNYNVRLRISLNGKSGPLQEPTLLKVASDPKGSSRGWVRVSANKRDFETTNGQTLRLIGENVCWPQGRGTFDYAEWFPATAASGQNFARLWMAPWWAGIEHKPGTLNRYGLDDAWRMDRVFELAEKNGLYVMLCFDHHGMYQVGTKSWGGANNFWPTNPYSLDQGGPCATPNDFFAKPEARHIYKKRLRYLVARYGASTALHSWQFFNEIDNVMRFLREEDVLDWHREMARTLRAIDPYNHLITTSLTGSSDRPSFWKLPEFDFAIYHSYGEASLGAGLATRTATALHRYDKPFLIGEFGVSAASWSINLDPYLRGFRQALWGGALGGSVGTALSWWWEDIHSDNVYALYKSVHDILYSAGWQNDEWTPIEPRQVSPRPTEVTTPRPEGATFNADLALQRSRLMKLSNSYALSDPLAVARSAEYVSAYLHGSRFADLRSPHRLSANFAPKANLALKLRMLGGAAELVVRIDGREMIREKLGTPAGENPAYQTTDKTYTLDLPAGRHLVEMYNEGEDWIILDSLKLQGVLPSFIAGDWNFEPEVFGLRQRDKAIVYVVSPQIVWPANALRYNPSMEQQCRIAITDLTAGAYVARVHDPRNASLQIELKAKSDGKLLELVLPDFNEDLVVIVSKTIGE
jgi:hypothetical protein